MKSFITSSLFDQESFYPAFRRDLEKAKNEVIIESPFITSRRMNSFMPMLKCLRKRGVKVVVNTKPIDEQMIDYYFQSKQIVEELQQIGVTVLFTVGHHRKLAIIDKRITWEGSLNILSQYDSCEVMRRMYSEVIANQMLAFLGLDRFIA